MQNLIKIQQGRNYNILDNEIVTVRTYDSINKKEITAMARDTNNNLKKYQKIDQNTYLDTTTGEIKEYKKNTIKNEKSIKRSMREARKLAENNFVGDDDEYFITLTTREIVEDIEQIKKYLKNFIKKLKRSSSADIKYMCFFETQERGSWHVHMLLKGIGHLSNINVEKKWNYGHTKTMKMSNKKTDVEINEKKALKDKNSFLACQSSNNVKKAIIYITKSDTKQSLPSNTRAYIASRNLDKPKKQKMSYGEFKKQCKETGLSKKESYTTSIINASNDKIINRIKSEQWY